MPNIIRLKKGEQTWSQHFSDDNDCMDVVEEFEEVEGKTEAKYTFYLNETNLSLQTELKALPARAPLLR